MHSLFIIIQAVAAFALGTQANLSRLETPESAPIKPHIMIVSMFEPESQIWFDRFNTSGLGDISHTAVPVPGLSMLFPHIYCTATADICHLTVGEGEINAAISMVATVLSSKFDLRQTYWLLGGIGGVNPRHATLGSVAFSRYEVQVALQYEIDARDVPDGWSTGYIPYGRKQPLEYPSVLYGTEVFEMNAALRDIAYDFAIKAKLEDAPGPRAYRAKYIASGTLYKQGTQPPSILKCDGATSDVYFTGNRISTAFENITKVWTNGTGEYCMSAQEDTATLEALVRGGIEGLVDFGRVIVMRAGSNFDRPPPGQTDYDHLTGEDQNGFEISVTNTYNAGIEIVRGIAQGWNCTFEQGIPASNYIGDIFGSLGGKPDFGPGSITDGKPRDSSAKAARLHRPWTKNMRRRGRSGRYNAKNL